ncbi:hypothetical protein QA648_36025 (plasmid) [Rhizobium sp. CB3171]|uniref:hypothetical protein n=1 Tax=Rhizobium sp. CB3171 TaxID=3039157 RepID=UPI0024B25603|nr:hypothetical protein [Rhizobium sp. CB3171]WFU07305.1 hypothetical protein QA648_36025 [Rhizobium sp. CB3171]
MTYDEKPVLSELSNPTAGQVINRIWGVAGYIRTTGNEPCPANRSFKPVLQETKSKKRPAIISAEPSEDPSGKDAAFKKGTNARAG